MRFSYSRRLFAGLTMVALATPCTVWAVDQAAPAAANVKSCTVCHAPEQGQMRAFFDGVAMKSQTIQLKLDSSFEVVRFDEDNLQIINGSTPDDVERSLRDIKKGHEVRVAYFEADNGVKTISELAIKPKMTVAIEKQLSAEEVANLIAGKEQYTLIDARPPQKFQEGAIPTAINIPFPAFEKNLDKLPQDKNALIVYYCAGAT